MIASNKLRNFKKIRDWTIVPIVGIGVTNPSSRLQVAGNITPDTTATKDIGSTTLRWNNIYLSNAPNVSSDIRLKKDVMNSDLGLDFINSLRPVSWKWKDENQGSTRHYGLIAQETEEALVRAQKTDEPVIVDHDKESDSYSVRYTELISPIIKAVQELFQKFISVERSIASLQNSKAEKVELHRAQEKIQVLEAQNASQKKELEELKSRLERIEKAMHKK